MSRYVLGEGKFARFVLDDGWEYVERFGLTGIVVVVAVTTNKEIILIEQYRPPVKSIVVELPAGMVGDISAEESFVDAGKRELMEETGYRADRMEFLMRGPLSAGLSTEIVDLYLATDVVRVSEGGGDETETITCHEIPLKSVRFWLEEVAQTQKIIDPKVYAALYFATNELGV